MPRGFDSQFDMRFRILAPRRGTSILDCVDCSSGLLTRWSAGCPAMRSGTAVSDQGGKLPPNRRISFAAWLELQEQKATSSTASSTVVGPFAHYGKPPSPRTWSFPGLRVACGPPACGIDDFQNGVWSNDQLRMHIELGIRAHITRMTGQLAPGTMSPTEARDRAAARVKARRIAPTRLPAPVKVKTLPEPLAGAAEGVEGAEDAPLLDVRPQPVSLAQILFVAVGVPLACALIAALAEYAWYSVALAFSLPALGIFAYMVTPLSTAPTQSPSSVKDELLSVDSKALADKAQRWYSDLIAARRAIGDGAGRFFAVHAEPIAVLLAKAMQISMGVSALVQLRSLALQHDVAAAARLLGLICFAVQLPDSFGWLLAEFGAIATLISLFNSTRVTLEDRCMSAADSITTKVRPSFSSLSSASPFSSAAFDRCLASNKYLRLLADQVSQDLVRRLDDLGYLVRQSPLKSLVAVLNLVMAIEGFRLHANLPSVGDLPVLFGLPSVMSLPFAEEVMKWLASPDHAWAVHNWSSDTNPCENESPCQALGPAGDCTLRSQAWYPTSAEALNLQLGRVAEGSLLASIFYQMTAPSRFSLYIAASNQSCIVDVTSSTGGEHTIETRLCNLVFVIPSPPPLPPPLSPPPARPPLPPPFSPPPTTPPPSPHDPPIPRPPPSPLQPHPAPLQPPQAPSLPPTKISSSPTPSKLSNGDTDRIIQPFIESEETDARRLLGMWCPAPLQFFIAPSLSAMPHTVALSLMNGHGSVGFDALLVEVIAEREEGAEEEREEPKEQEQEQHEVEEEAGLDRAENSNQESESNMRRSKTSKGDEEEQEEDQEEEEAGFGGADGSNENGFGDTGDAFAGLGEMAAVTSTITTGVATSDFVRKRLRPKEFEEGKKREAAKNEMRQRQAKAEARLYEWVAEANAEPLQVDLREGSTLIQEGTDALVSPALLDEAVACMQSVQDAQQAGARRRAQARQHILALCLEPAVGVNLSELEEAIDEGLKAKVELEALQAANVKLREAAAVQKRRSRALKRLERIVQAQPESDDPQALTIGGQAMEELEHAQAEAEALKERIAKLESKVAAGELAEQEMNELKESQEALTALETIIAKAEASEAKKYMIATDFSEPSRRQSAGQMSSTQPEKAHKSMGPEHVRMEAEHLGMRIDVEELRLALEDARDACIDPSKIKAMEELLKRTEATQAMMAMSVGGLAGKLKKKATDRRKKEEAVERLESEMQDVTKALEKLKDTKNSPTLEDELSDLEMAISHATKLGVRTETAEQTLSEVREIIGNRNAAAQQLQNVKQQVMLALDRTSLPHSTQDELKSIEDELMSALELAGSTFVDASAQDDAHQAFDSLERTILRRSSAVQLLEEVMKKVEHIKPKKGATSSRAAAINPEDPAILEMERALEDARKAGVHMDEVKKAQAAYEAATADKQLVIAARDVRDAARKLPITRDASSFEKTLADLKMQIEKMRLLQGHGTPSLEFDRACSELRQGQKLLDRHAAAAAILSEAMESVCQLLDGRVFQRSSQKSGSADGYRMQTMLDQATTKLRGAIEDAKNAHVDFKSAQQLLETLETRASRAPPARPPLAVAPAAQQLGGTSSSGGDNSGLFTA